MLRGDAMTAVMSVPFTGGLGRAEGLFRSLTDCDVLRRMQSKVLRTTNWATSGTLWGLG